MTTSMRVRPSAGARPTATRRLWPIAVAVLLAGVVPVAAQHPFVHDVRPGPGVVAVGQLSDYLAVLKGTPGDTKVYLLEGKAPGATVFVAGGTHANEIAGIMAAVLLVERAGVSAGRLIVIPNANNSAVTFSDPERPGPEWITLATPGGPRRFKYGSRRTNPAHQGAADPPKFHHPQSSEEIEGAEARNLDRAHPGRADGTLTEKIAAAMLALLKAEKVDVAFDLHEANPGGRLAWMLVANPKSVELAAVAVLGLEADGIAMKLEPSSETFRGLSHREWGDATPAQSFLIETPNPGMGENPKNADVVNDKELPLSRRVGVHLATMMAVLSAWNDAAAPGRIATITGLPSLADLQARGVGAFLK